MNAVSALWYENYNYSLDQTNQRLIINSSKGNYKSDQILNIIVPARTVINSTTYTTVLDNTTTTGNARRESLWSAEGDTLTGITIENGVELSANAAYLFHAMSRLKTLNISGLNTENATDMSYMFDGCSGLTSLDLSGFNTAKVQNMSHMFSRCSGLKSLVLSSFNTAKVQSMYGMFAGCSGLTSLDLNNFNTAEVQNMSYMFSHCSGLSYLDLSRFDTRRVTDMSGMFSDCSSLKRLNVSSFDTSSVTDMSYMFAGCSGLEDLDVTNFATAKVGRGGSNQYAGSFSGMFGELSAEVSVLDLRSFNMSGEGNLFSASHIVDLYLPVQATKNCSYDIKSLARIYYAGTKGQWQALGNSVPEGVDVIFNYTGPVKTPPAPTNDGAVTTTWYEDYNYYLSEKTKRLVLTSSKGNFKATKRGSVTVPAKTKINGVIYITVLDNTRNSLGETKSLWDAEGNTLTSITIENGVELSTNAAYLFSGMSKLKILNISGLNTESATNMSDMFRGCSSLTSLELSGFNTSEVRDMSGMFIGCSGLTGLDLSSFDTRRVMDMSSMFYECSGLKQLNVSSFDTSNVTDMNGMFYDCISLEKLDVTNFATAKVGRGGSNQNIGSFGSMFHGLSLEEPVLDLRSFNMSGAPSPEQSGSSYLFYGGHIVDLYLPVQATKNTLYSNNGLARIYYAGTREQWKALHNSVLAGVDIIYNYTGPVITSTVTEKDNPGTTGGKWIKDKQTGKYWYKRKNGSYPKSKWEKIDYKWYYFDKSGWMLTKWQKLNNKWYYLGTNGVMVTGWQKIGKKWYYFNDSGAMVTGWKKIDKKWYYLSDTGVMKKGWLSDGGKWYYLDKSGVMTTGWKKISNKWYYFNNSGVMKTGWLKSGGRWYYLKSSGAMASNESVKIGSKTYRFDKNGISTNA